MATSAKLREGSHGNLTLRKENDKLEQDIAEMESTLFQQKAKLVNDSSIRNQISKATGNSIWLSGAKGQLSGYRSHRGLPENHSLLDKNSAKLARRAKSAGALEGRRTRTQSFTPVSGSREELVTERRTGSGDTASAKTVSREPLKGTSRIKSAPVRQSSTRKTEGKMNHHRAQSLRDGIKVNALSNTSDRLTQSGKLGKTGERKVSFDLSSEDELAPTHTSANDSFIDCGQPVIKTMTRSTVSKGSKPQEMGSHSERIAHLKAKVIAKASANLKPELLSTLPKEKHNRSADVEVSHTNGIERKEIEGQRSCGANTSKLPETARDTRASSAAQGNRPGTSRRQRISKDKTVLLQDNRKVTGQPKAETDKGDRGTDSLFDPSVELWLASLHLDDSLQCAKIFRRNRVTMDGLHSITENDLSQMGMISEADIKTILQGIERLQLSRTFLPREVTGNGEMITKTSEQHEEEASQTTRLLALVDNERFEETFTHKNSSTPTTSYTPVMSSLSWSEGVLVTPEQSLKSSHAEMSDRQKGIDKTDSKESSALEENAKVNSTEGSPLPDLNRQNTDKKIGPQQIKSGKPNTKKRSGVLSADVVNRTLTSGVQSAMTKLRQRQEQEINEQKRQDRLRRAKRAERDKLALQHARRQQEKLEQKQAEDGEGAGGRAKDDVEDVDEESSPEASSSFRRDGSSDRDTTPDQDVMKINIQGGALLSRTSPSKQSNQDDPLMTGAPKAAKSPRGTPEDRLKDLELIIQGVQDKESSAVTAAQFEKLQQQLASLKKDLAAANVMASTSEEPIVRASTRAQSATKSSGAARGVYSSMSKNELMREVRKQKEQHKKQIRLLESELSRLRHRDPVRSCELPEGDILYHQEDTIGEGTFSHVFRGYFNGSEVAIKRLKIPLAEADRNYFAEEVSLLHELRHPRVVLLLGVCTTGTLPLMVLEYMAGGSLYTRIHDKKRECLDHVAYYQVARDIALGMNYLHRHRPQVLHLDLKSMNVLLGMHGRAKIGDFGFAKLRHEAEASAKGKVQGTPAWMAPELMENTSSSLTDKVDVYSFGVILWEMLTGQRPYRGLSVFQVLEAVQQRRRPDIPISCPEPLRRLIIMCWDHKPNKRPAFKDILIALEALAFPPEWRTLLSAANIPREAMEDPASARSIITLVHGSMRMTQRELDELALTSHERAMEISSGGRGQDEVGQEVRGQLADRVEAMSSSSPHTVSEGMDLDSLDIEIQPSTKQSTRIYNEDDFKPGPTIHGGIRNRLTSPREHKEDVQLGISPRSTKEGTATEPKKNKGDIPLPPPIQPTLLMGLPAWGTKPRVDDRSLEGSTAPSKAKPKSKAVLPVAGRVSLDPNLLLAQRNNLRTTEAGPHPSQLPSLSQLGEQRMTSIAEILRKAVAARRTALQEDAHSLEHPNSDSLQSAASDSNWQ